MIHRRRLWSAVPLIWLFVWLAVSGLVGDSPTMDEQNHLARGIAYLRTGDPRLSVEHPPLVNALSAAPLLTLPNVRLPLDQPSWTERFPPMTFWYDFADTFMWRLGNDVSLITFLGRLQIVYLTITLALLASVVARRLWGGSAGWWALIFILFDPNILAHGRVITTDLGGTLFIFLATWAIWLLWQPGRPLGRRLPFAALAIGLAFSAKLTSLAFIPLWILLAFVPPAANQDGYWPAALRRLAPLAAAGVGGLLVVWVVYLFEWGNFLFVDPRLLWLNGYAGPMPTFWSGIERILLLSGGGRPAFLWGSFSTEGFWYYFPFALAVKTPVLVLALILGTPVYLLAGRDRSVALWWLIPPLGYLALSSNSGLNLGYRHLMPLLPFFYVLIAGWCARWLTLFGRSREPARYLRRLYAVLFLVGMIVPAVWVAPHHLSFFNALAGGPASGYRYLVDSNVDWGQDLLRLRSWLQENQVDDLHLSWFGTADPTYYGVDYTPLPGVPYHFNLWWETSFDRQNPPPGTYAISVTNYWEMPLRPEEKTVFAWFRERPPDARIGYSILIYEVQGAARP